MFSLIARYSSHSVYLIITSTTNGYNVAFVTNALPFMTIIPLPYHRDSSRIFNAIRQLPFACWLDSGKPNSASGRYDIMCALPSQRWVAEQQSCHIYDYEYLLNSADINNSDIKSADLNSHDINDHKKLNYKHIHKQVNAEPFTLIKAAAQQLIQTEKRTDETPALPFTGGIISYFSYDLGRQKMGIDKDSATACSLADMAAGLYLWAIVQDHQEKTCYLTALSSCDPQQLSFIEDLLKQTLSVKQKLPVQEPSSQWDAPLLIGSLQSNTDYPEYCQKIARINDYIHAGDCYQVNYSQCFSAPYQGDPYSAYRVLRHEMASPFSAFMDLGNNQAILSLSPERLLQTHENQALTQPIKGTMTRDKDQQTDVKNAQELQASVKNRAENLMIVDLLRNDLGKNCRLGSIDVPSLFHLESYPNVHHLVSNITGTIAEDKTALDVFEGCFPGGSITGAPKKRAMEIIEELESCQRSIYCGSIAYINAWGDMDSNITIRTIACDGNNLFCWGGGGIVADSNADEEYQESLTKINTILDVLKQFSE